MCDIFRMNMEYSLVLLTFLLILKMSSCIRCYKCSPDEGYQGVSLCKNFDSSDRFLDDCQHSTMCFKRETTLDLGNGMTSVIVHRDCASQTLAGDQARINGKWQLVNTIYEPYDEDCKEDRSDPDRPSRTLNCYCRGDYCNATDTTPTPHILIYIICIFLIS